VATLQQQDQEQSTPAVELPVELNSNEMFQHVQHDWNFGGINLMSPNCNYIESFFKLSSNSNHIFIF